jgi:hypothetical protein
MSSLFLYTLMNYGSMALVVVGIGVGVVLTNGPVRALLAAALVVELIKMVLALTNPPFLYSGGEVAVFAYSLVQMLISVAPVLLVVAASILGALKVADKEATIAALTDTKTDTWRQPDASPDPRLLAE